MDVTQHIHTHDCYKETQLPACYEYRLAELESLLVHYQEELRRVGGVLDRIEAGVSRILHPAPRKDV